VWLTSLTPRGPVQVKAARYGSFYGALARAELERFFFLDDADQEKVQAKRLTHNRLGFAVQLTTVRFLRRFMPDPRQVPVEVAEYLAEQLGITDASVLAEYGERDGTARTHAGEIQQDGGAGARVSELDRPRRGPVRVSGPQMKAALERAEEIAALGMGEVDVSGVPPRRLATLLATAVYLTTRAASDSN
jgi:hypothetical protein